MKIGVIGLGKLGLPVALAMEAAGHEVHGWDPSESVQNTIDSKVLPYMGYGIQGAPLSPREAGVAMALITLNVEPDVEVIGFDTSVYAAGISARQRLDDALNSFPRTGGGTDCSLPMEYAIKKNKAFNGFVIYTDHQTWAGTRYHPAQALAQYRNQSGIQARLATVAMVAYATKINDPTDPGSLDVLGFDTATPNLISEFIAGKL